MRALAGQVWTPAGWLDGHVLVDAGQVREVRRGPPPREAEVAARGVVVPSFVDAHTHLGDAVARGEALPATLAEAVRPPLGLKHRVLAATPEPALVEGMRGAAREVDASGAGALVDFREGGPRGVAQLREALKGSPLRARILGRPAAMDFDAAEVRALLRDADGLALSSLPDVGAAKAAMLASAARAAGKAFALHASEPAREPVEPVLALRPTLLVHLTHATRADLERVRDAGCAVAVCVRSNLRWLKRLPDVRAMLDLGIPVGLGTDNAMLGPCDVRAEARALLAALPAVSADEALAMLVAGGRKALSPAGPIEPLQPGAPADLLVYAPKGPRPAAAVLAADAALVHRERSARPWSSTAS